MTIQYQFSICALRCRISSDQPLRFDSDSQEFLISEAPLQEADLEMRLRLAEKFALPDFPPAGIGEKCGAWYAGADVSRCCRMGEKSSYFSRVDYRLDQPGRADYNIPQQEWAWVRNIQYLWFGSMLNYLLLPFRVLIFHASYIQHNGRAILFTAPSQTGKSTQAELWRVHRGAQVINGDKAGVRLDGAPMAHGVPFSGTSGICRNVSLPLEAIVVLSQAPVNTVRRLPPSEAAAALCGNVFVDHYIPEEWQQALNLLLDLVAGVPVYALACTPDVRAVEALEQAMAREGREKSPVKEAAP